MVVLTGDIIILKGTSPADLKLGDIIVFKANRPDPIIHRIVKKWKEDDSYYFQTKGDNNAMSINFEERISKDNIIGKSLFKVPYLGYIKIWFVDLLNLFIK